MDLIYNFLREYPYGQQVPPQMISIPSILVKKICRAKKLSDSNKLSGLVVENLIYIDQILCLLNMQMLYEIVNRDIFINLPISYFEKLFVSFYNNFMAKGNFSDLLDMDNKYNRYYNFCDVSERISKLKEELRAFGFYNFYLGTDAVNYLFGNYKKRGVVHFISIYLCESLKINFDSDISSIIFKDKFYNILHTSKYNIIVYNHKEMSPIHVIDYYENNFIIDYQNKVFCNPKFVLNLYSPIKLAFHNLLASSYKKLTNIHVKLFGYKIPKYEVCYSCKKYLGDYHYYKKSMCIKCGLFYGMKYEDTANLSGAIVFITGIRQKIGYAAAIKILRCGGTVYGTSRYVYATLLNYRSELDYDSFKDRLFIIKCDFTKMNEFSKVMQTLKNVNFSAIINNACQTVLPDSSYTNELSRIDSVVSERVEQIYGKFSTELSLNVETSCLNISQISNLNLSLEQICGTELGELNDNKTISLPFVKDEEKSSWLNTLENISVEEIFTANMVNVMAPTIIINQLLPNLQSPRIIINVTALEGSFTNKKNKNHPHTNSCKAGLNMLSRTLSEDSSLLVYAIDPGFVSGVLSTTHSYPITMYDGGAKLVDPIISYFNGITLPSGYYRNYIITKWEA